MIRKDRLLAQTLKVLSFNSENPPGREKALADYILRDMKQLGLDVKTYTYAKNRPNIIATLKGSLPREKARSNALLLTPHFDTVPIGGGWSKKPLGEIKGNKIYGRGASDDKGNLASAMEVMHSLVEDGFRPRKDIVMAATVDEETGSKFGIVPLIREKVIKAGLALVLDSDEGDAIIAQKGLLHCRVQIFGKKAHGAYNWKGVNAIEIAATVIEQLKQIKFQYRKHSLLHGPTVNIGTIRGGDKVNMVADFCEFSVDIRYASSMNGQDVIAQLKQVVRSKTAKFKVLVDDHQFPYEISSKHPFVRLFSRIADETKTKIKLKGSEGATVITFFQKQGIPAFATGFGAYGTAHTTDEYIKINTLVKGTRFLDRYVRAYDAL